MDQQNIINLLRSTLDISHQKEASAQLDQMYKIIGFAPTLLQIVMNNQVEMPVRQSGAIYLKNMVKRSWADPGLHLKYKPREPMPFLIHEQDCAVLRDTMVDAAVHVPDILRYRAEEKRQPVVDAMNLLLPIMYQRMCELMPDIGECSVLLQKQILKILRSYLLHQLPLEHITREVFTQWMELIRQVAERPVPEQANQIDEEERCNLCWWKCRKWALHLLNRTFERYGSPGKVLKQYEDFAAWYLKAFTPGTLKVLIGILDNYRSGQYVAPRVLQQTINYLNKCVPLSFSWKLLKPHMLVVIKDVIFPVMCFSDADASMWEDDPYEFIRVKYDPMEDSVSPAISAASLLNSVAKKRKDMLRDTMMFVVQVLTSSETTPRQKDGILHLVGSISKVLLSKQLYKSQMEMMVTTHVYPEFTSPHGFLRARACWAMQHFSKIKFQNDENLVTGVNALTHCLLNDKEMPVQVEAAIGLQMTLHFQTKAVKILEPNIRAVLVRMLDVITTTDNQELTSSVQRIVYTYHEQLMPIALELATRVLDAFKGICTQCGGDEAEDKMPAAMGLLNTMDSILDVWEDEPEICAQLEPVFLQAVVFVLENSIMDLYEDVFKIVISLTMTRISPDMWKIFEMLYKVFEDGGIDYFDEMMPSLHNYVTVDTEGFLANEARVVAMYNMCKAVLTGDQDEYKELHAVKLLECIILQCQGRIQKFIPMFIQLVVERLMQAMQSGDLRVMCLQTLIAVLYTEPALLLETFSKTPIPNTNQTLVDHFITQWISDHEHFSGIHDRKLYVLGWCVLMQLQSRPPAVDTATNQILPAMVVILHGLKRAYEARALEEGDDSDSDEEDEVASLDEDEDELDEESNQYLELLQKKVQEASPSSPFTISSQIIEDDSSEYSLDYDELFEDYTTPLDAADCPVDEFVVFRETLEGLQRAQPEWYGALTAPLSEEDRKHLQEAFTMAEQRKAARHAEAIKKQGGYNFEQKTVPSSFNFGGGNVTFGSP
ncbi:importin-7-like isoform X2 [Amphibalanus amphitrite]|uniref:importin-7-like isoform X2 n=1 Tax=Amphibalanus amphitrite TaxID=1232801 RepID=UPI001C8FE773|nr:importin-7-like isoform X2 [Amphibalanus amphitrite]